jgi:hypothetical protein
MILTEKIFDSVHGFIHLTKEEKQLLDNPAFNRLHYLHQLGIAYLVYPGATHSRFEHSLGVMHLASAIYDQIFDTPNTFHKLALRMGALCHDLGHLPFSHTAEKQILGEKGHEIKTLEILNSSLFKTYFESFEKKFPGFKELVLKIAISPEVFLHIYPDKAYSDIDWILSKIVSGDYFGSDRIDYLLRDSKCTGVSSGFFDYPQLIQMLSLARYKDKPVIALNEKGLHAAEALLIARHYMHDRVYNHPAVLAYNQALKTFIKEALPIDLKKVDPETYVTYTDAWVSNLFLKASIDPSAKGHEAAKILTKKEPKKRTDELKKEGSKDSKSLYLIKQSGECVAIKPKPVFPGFFDF